MLGMSSVWMSIAPIEMNHILWIWETSLTQIMKNEFDWIDFEMSVNWFCSLLICTYKYRFHVVFVYIYLAN